jgi:hypothetical protein
MHAKPVGRTNEICWKLERGALKKLCTPALESLPQLRFRLGSEEYWKHWEYTREFLETCQQRPPFPMEYVFLWFGLHFSGMRCFLFWNLSFSNRILKSDLEFECAWVFSWNRLMENRNESGVVETSHILKRLPWPNMSTTEPSFSGLYTYLKQVFWCNQNIPGLMYRWLETTILLFISLIDAQQGISTVPQSSY